jgi:hypothetical protein
MPRLQDHIWSSAFTTICGCIRGLLQSLAASSKSWSDCTMSTCYGDIEKTGHASHIKTGPRRAASCVPMSSLTTPIEFLCPTPLEPRQEGMVNIENASSHRIVELFGVNLNIARQCNQFYLVFSDKFDYRRFPAHSLMLWLSQDGKTYITDCEKLTNVLVIRYY